MKDDFKKPFTAPPAIFIAAFVVGLVLDSLFPFPLLPLDLQIVIGSTVIIIGMLLIRSSMTEIKKAKTTYNPYAASTNLTTSGIYRFSRNPGYLGLAMVLLGLAFLIDGIWIAATLVIAVLVIHRFVIKLEENKLVNAFGEEYEQYLSRVRPWL